MTLIRPQSFQGAQLKRVENTLLNRVRLATAFVNGEIRKRAPVDTGNLRGSYTSKVYKDGTSIIGKVSTNVIYSWYQEFGVPSRNIPAHPHARPGLKDNKTQIRKYLREE